MPTLSGPEYLNGQFSVAADGTVSLTTTPFPISGGTFTGPIMLPAGTVAANSVQIVNPGTGMFGIAAGNQLAFATNGVERVRIDNNGNVGIGTTTPGAKLHVGGNATSGGVEGTGSTVIFGAPDDGYASVVIQRSGVVNPQVLDFGVNQASLYSEIQSAQNGINVGPLLLNRQGGNVGIGTSAPVVSKFQVSGSQSGAAPYLAYFQNTHNTVGDTVVVVLGGPTATDTATKLILFTDGPATGTQGAITRNGVGAVAYGTASDERLKSDITESRRGLDALMAIKVSDYKMGETASQGLLAQDVAKVYPEAVHEGGKDPNLEPWMIDYGRLSPLLIKGMQQQQEMIAALQAKVTALESATVH